MQLIRKPSSLVARAGHRGNALGTHFLNNSVGLGRFDSQGIGFSCQVLNIRLSQEKDSSYGVHALGIGTAPALLIRLMSFFCHLNNVVLKNAQRIVLSG